MTDVTEFTKVDIQQLQRLLGKPMMYKMFEMAKSVNIRANKVDPAVTGNLAGLDSAGDLVDSGLNIGDWLEPGDVSGTPGEITVTDNGDGTITISIPDNFLPSAISGTPNQITITDDGDGSITISIPTGANITFASLGLKILDTNVSHALTIFLNSDLTASRTLFLVTGDSDRTLSLLGNLFVESVSRLNHYIQLWARGGKHTDSSNSRGWVKWNSGYRNVGGRSLSSKSRGIRQNLSGRNRLR
ncbi:hypothetical protein LCGC14_3041470 [marine sediment metagenome]|uniref:Uncharacterized protein n=1 Tax=marine sediment metagenome TaxID=412755 RepID=A0A0F8WPA9_9ZZZZ